MKNLSRLVTLLILITASVRTFAQVYDQTDRKKISAFTSTVDTYHIQGDELLPLVKERISHLFILEAETSFRCFTQSDQETLQASFDQFDEFPLLCATQFLESAYQIYSRRMEQRAAFLKNPPKIHWDQTDTMHLYSRYNFDYYPENEDALILSWTKSLKYETLLAKSPADTTAKKLNALLHSLIDIEQCKLEQLQSPMKGLKNDLMFKFMKAYAKCFDPHSDFYDQESMELYNSSLSSDLYSTGIYATIESEKMIVDYVEPASDIWKKHQVDEGDEILYIRCGDIGGHPSCLTADELESCFFSPDHKEVFMRIKSKKTGAVQEFNLRKEISKNLYNEIYAATMSTGGDVTLGYITFPTFYLQHSDFDTGVSEDLARILRDMKAKNIEGLIIDLRNNGGGSVEEAIDLSGFFIDYGPLFWSESSFDESPTLNQDYNHGLLYDGKVLIMTNYATASASEMFLSAMKQYHRVLHVGGPTFGKATGQTVVPIDLVGYPIPFGYLKVTTLTVQQLDGTSYQQEGLQPDLSLPDPGFGFMTREDHQPYALPNKVISQTAKPTTVHELDLPEQVYSLHAERMKNNPTLRYIQAFQDSLLQVSHEQFPVILNKSKDIEQKINYALLENSVHYEIESLSDTELDERMSSELQKDPMLYESLRILKDWITEE